MSDFFSENTEKPKKSIVELYEERLFKKPVQKPNGSLCLLILGENGSCKSGIALDNLTEEDKKNGMKEVIVDADSGCLPLIIAYHLEDYMNGNLIHIDPLEWKENEKGQSVPDYDQTLQNISNIGLTLQKVGKKHKVKTVVLDGLSMIKKHSEFKMRLDNELGSIVNTSFDFKFYKERRQTFNEIVNLYKSLEMDKIFIALPDFIIPQTINPEHPPSAITTDLNAAAFETILCRAEEDSKGNTKWFAKLTKNKLGLEDVGKEICFSEVKVDKKGNRASNWSPELVWNLLQSEKEKKN